MAYDTTQIISSIVNAPISPSSREIAAELVDAWIQEHGAFDEQFETLAAEAPWYLWLDKDTLLVGVIDRIARDDEDILGTEWKSAKSPQQNKDGSDSAWWNEEVWLEGISTGTQLAIYGLALSRGTFVLDDGRRLWIPKVRNPRMLVRAAVKCSPPRFWPTNFEDGVFRFPEAYLKKVYDALRAKAEQLRAARRSTLIPWALPGNHCTNRFKKLCPYHKDFCVAGKHPADVPKTVFDESDPGSVAIQYALRNSKQPKNNPDLIIFSASSFDTSQQCPERYRLLMGGYTEKEQDANLEIGTGLHTGLAQFYRQQMKAHNGKPRKHK